MSMLNINGVELELDLLDADVMEQFETLTNDIVVKMNNKNTFSNVKASAAMKLQCSYIDEFFDKMFGKGTAEMIFGDKMHLGEHLDAFGQVMQASNDSNREVSELTMKYGVGRLQNREGRPNGYKQKYNNRQNGGKYKQ